MPTYSVTGNLRFPGTFLSKSRPFMSTDEQRAGDVIMRTFERTWKPGTDPVEHMEMLQRRALDRIAEVGHGVFADEVAKRTGGHDGG